jgi:hypothetical protein
MSITLALADAANNCVREGAEAVVTMKSGVQYIGTLKPKSGAALGTYHMEIGQGWATFLTDEVAGVESRKPTGSRY